MQFNTAPPPGEEQAAWPARLTPMYGDTLMAGTIQKSILPKGTVYKLTAQIEYVKLF